MYPTPESELNAKKSHLLILIKMAEANRSIDPMEDRFIMDIGAKLGFSSKDVHTVKENRENIPFKIPLDEKDRMTQFYHLLFLMKIDGEVSEKEKVLCRELGFRLGIRPLLIEDLMGIMSTYIRNKVPAGVMLDAIRKYLN